MSVITSDIASGRAPSGRAPAMVCADSQCNRAGIRVFDSDGKCSDCGEDMVDATTAAIDAVYDLPEHEDIEYEPDTFDRISARLARERGYDNRRDESDAIWPRDRQRSHGYNHLNDGHGISHRPTRSSSPVQIHTAAVKDTFTCPSDLTGCPVAAKSKIYIPMQMFNDWVFFAGQLDVEWIAYLKGHAVEGEANAWAITEMYFPNQKANGVHVSAADGEIQPGTIAAVHSHVDFNAFFSATDIEHFNHQIELVVNRKGDILANSRVKLECGRWHRGPADIEFIQVDRELELQQQLESRLSTDHKSVFTVPAGRSESVAAAVAGGGRKPGGRKQ